MIGLDALDKYIVSITDNPYLKINLEDKQRFYDLMVPYIKSTNVKSFIKFLSGVATSDNPINDIPRLLIQYKDLISYGFFTMMIDNFIIDPSRKICEVTNHQAIDIVLSHTDRYIIDILEKHVAKKWKQNRLYLTTEDKVLKQNPHNRRTQNYKIHEMLSVDFQSIEQYITLCKKRDINIFTFSTLFKHYVNEQYLNLGFVIHNQDFKYKLIFLTRESNLGQTGSDS